MTEWSADERCGVGVAGVEGREFDVGVGLGVAVAGKAFKGRTERAMAAGRAGWERCSGGCTVNREDQ